MVVYIILFIFTCVMCNYIDKIQKKDESSISLNKSKIVFKKNILFPYVILFIPLWLIMGLRYYIGIDFYNYKVIFQFACNGKRYYGIEIGYYLINRLVSLFTKESQWLFIIIAFLMIMLFLKGFANNSKNIYIQLVIFLGVGYYFYAMNIMREYLAISIMCMAFHYLEQEDLKKFIVSLVIAVSIHTSTLIWIPVIILVKYVRTQKFYLVTLVFAIITRIGFDYLVQLIIKFTTYGHFFTSGDGYITTKISWANLLVSGLTLAVFFFRRKVLLQINSKNEERIKYVWLMFLGYAFFYVLGDAVVRLELHFFFIILAILSDAFESFSAKTKSTLKFIFSSFMLSLMCYLLNYSANAANKFIPYVSWTSVIWQ